MKKKVNTKDVLAIAALSDTAAGFLESLADRTQNRKVTAVESVMASQKAPRREVIEMFKAMDEAGLGTFIVGRRNQRSRFQWTTRMIDVGQAAIGETEEIEELDDNELSFGDFEDELDEAEIRSLRDASIDEIVKELKARGAQTVQIQF